MSNKYDKVAAHVGYNDKAHTYTNTKTSNKYVSVTTLIHNFVPPFKADYWATYKAIKDVLGEATFGRFKRRAGGWESVVGYYGKHPNLLAQYTVAIELKKQWYFDEWDRVRDNACELGSAIHNELEGAAYHSQQIRGDEVNYIVSQDNILALQDFSSNRVYPELLIYSDEFMVAGQADKVFKQGNYVDIHDYKTCKAIDVEGFRGETLLDPVSHLQNANYWIYTLQLSMYAFMLEQCGYTVRNLEMHWIYGDNPETSNVRDKVKTFHLKYMRDEVVKIMETNKF